LSQIIDITVYKVNAAVIKDGIAEDKVGITAHQDGILVPKLNIVVIKDGAAE